MLRRYCQLREYPPKIDSEKVDELQPTVSENRRVDALVTRLNDLDEVTKKLQCDSTTLSDARDLFDADIDVFPETAYRLWSTSEIVHFSVLESAVVNLQKKNSCGLPREERISVKPFETIERKNVELCELSTSFVERSLSSEWRRLKNRACAYTDTRFVVLSSNICECLFSQVGHVFSDRRPGLTPVNLEVQIFSTQTVTYGVMTTWKSWLLTSTIVEINQDILSFTFASHGISILFLAE